MIRRLGPWLVALLILTALASWSLNALGDVSFTHAQFMAEPANLNLPWDGQVAEVFVKKGAFVRKGQPLARLESHSQEARLANAKAFLDAWTGAGNTIVPARITHITQQLEALRTRVRGLRQEERRGYENVEVQALLHVQKLLALRTLDAQTRLGTPTAQGTPIDNAARQKVINDERNARGALERSRVDFEVLHRARIVAEKEIQTAKQSLSAAKRRQQYFQQQTARNAQAITERQQRQAIAEADVRAAKEDLAQVTLLAPIDGRVAELALAKGDFITSNQTVVRIQPILPDVWITAKTDAASTKRLFIDMPVVLRVAGAHSGKLMGRIAWIDIDGQTAEVRIEFVDVAPEDIASLQHRASATVHVPWWSMMQTLWH